MLKNILLDFAADHNDLLKTLQRKETELNIYMVNDIRIPYPENVASKRKLISP